MWYHSKICYCREDAEGIDGLHDVLKFAYMEEFQFDDENA